MMAPISLASLAHKYGGVLLEPDYPLQSLSTDSRKIASGQAFVALKGGNFDGHEYLQTAFEQGASALVTERVLPIRAPQPSRIPQWIVKNSLRALGHISVENRNLFAGKMIALTGSNGKTTVKEMIASILRQSGEVMATRGNLNNHIGVPLTLLSLNPEHQFAVVEMGASSLGEIHYLTEMARPDVALVNNVGDAHVGGFGSVKNIEIAKGEIFNGLSNVGTGVVNLDSPGADRYMDKLIGRRMMSFSIENNQADVCATDIKLADAASSFRLCSSVDDEIEISLQIPAKHNVLNALAAATCCLALHIPLQQIVSGLQSFSGVAGRLQQHRLTNGAFLIDDTYNASPSSVKAAVKTLAAMDGRSVLVLGDMGELGEDAIQLHKEVGVFAKNHAIDQLVTVGELSKHAAEGFGCGSYSFSNKRDAADLLLNELDGDVRILVKGSRSARMEDVVNSIKERGE